ncbi:MAG: hypothetical protein HXO51_06285 [Prevotella sp.]|nr:hypothetical protein [Prevotella sp.]
MRIKQTRKPQVSVVYSGSNESGTYTSRVAKAVCTSHSTPAKVGLTMPV